MNVNIRLIVDVGVPLLRYAPANHVSLRADCSGMHLDAGLDFVAHRSYGSGK